MLLADHLIEGLRAVAAIEGGLGTHRADTTVGLDGPRRAAVSLCQTVPMRWIALALAAIALGAGALPALADDRPKTRIVIKKLKHSGASGKVSSRAGSCVGGREVALFRLDGYVSRKLAKTRTNANGRWQVGKRLRNGRYFATVASASGCRYDNSRTETLR